MFILEQLLFSSPLFKSNEYDYILKEIVGIYEINKKGNVHIHSLMKIKSTCKYEKNIADIKKCLMKQFKTNSYGIDV